MTQRIVVLAGQVEIENEFTLYTTFVLCQTAQLHKMLAGQLFWASRICIFLEEELE